MQEDVGAAVVGRDETEPLSCAELHAFLQSPFANAIGIGYPTLDPAHHDVSYSKEWLPLRAKNPV